MAPLKILKIIWDVKNFTRHAFEIVRYILKKLLPEHKCNTIFLNKMYRASSRLVLPFFIYKTSKFLPTVLTK